MRIYRLYIKERLAFWPFAHIRLYSNELRQATFRPKQAKRPKRRGQAKTALVKWPDQANRFGLCNTLLLKHLQQKGQKAKENRGFEQGVFFLRVL